MERFNLWENTGHRVGPLVIFHFSHGQNLKKRHQRKKEKGPSLEKGFEHLGAVCCELAVEEEVHEVDLEENIGKVEELAGEKSEGIEVVIVPGSRSFIIIPGVGRCGCSWNKLST